MPTTVAMAYLDAWRWRMAGVNRVRLSASVQLEAARSPTVSAVLPGRDPALPEILVLAHHDTQAGNVGADDNASGVVALLEIARQLAQRRQRPRMCGPILRIARGGDSWLISIASLHRLGIGQCTVSVTARSPDMRR
jgi:hypothetical protein